MTTEQTLARLEAIQQALNAIEAQIPFTILPAAQEALEGEWEHLMSEMEMLTELLMNELEDTRGCERCSGCVYCQDASPGYDGADEV